MDARLKIAGGILLMLAILYLVLLASLLNQPTLGAPSSRDIFLVNSWILTIIIDGALGITLLVSEPSVFKRLTTLGLIILVVITFLMPPLFWLPLVIPWFKSRGPAV
jgi:hypothetical protein